MCLLATYALHYQPCRRLHVEMCAQLTDLSPLLPSPFSTSPCCIMQVKSSYVMVAPNGMRLLGDFGLSLVLSPTATGAGGMMELASGGAPGCAAPEQTVAFQQKR